MPIYHVHISSGSRADGQSAAVKVAYILREGAYGGRDDLVCWGSGCMPSWAAADPRQLFEAADLYERSNGRLFLHVWVALPNELTAAERHELGLAIAAALTAAGLPFVYAVHAGDPKSPGEPANPHIHIVISERINDNIPRDARQWFRRANPRDPARGGAAKDRRLKEVTWVDDSRRVVARLTNEHLKVAGCKARVTADSHEVRIVEAEAWGDTETADVLRRHPPGVHLGPAAAAIERDRIGGKRDEVPKVLRQGEPTERGDLARAKAAEEERVRGDLERVSAKLRRAREEEVRATESVAAARSAGLSEDRILAVYEESESTAEGSGWAAVDEAASSEAGRKKEAEGAAAATAREWLVDVDAVCGGARERNEDELDALEAETAAAKPVVASARAAGLDDAAIGRIYREAESQEYGSGWAAVTRATGERVQRKSAAEAAARGLDLSVEFIYANASHGADPVDHLERVTAIWGRARRAGLNNKQLDEIYGRAENRQVGTGWTVIEDATAKRVQRKLAAEALARGVVVDVDAVYRCARDRNEDELDALEQETAAAKPVVASARAAGLDDAAIGRIYREAESQEYGSGWAAVTRATGERVQRKSAAEAAARGLDLSVEFIYANASHGADPVDHLERVTAIWGRARRAGLNNKQLDEIYGRAENRQVGTGWTVIEDATAKRVQRKLAAEALARGVVVDVDAVYRCARDRNEDELDALEQETAAAKPVVASARAAGLGDAAIGRIRDAAESTERGSGWAAVSKATEDRNKRRAAAEMAAGEWLVDIDAVRRDVRDRNEDALEALEAATAAARPVVASARAAGLGDVTIGRIRAAAESTERGSGWAAVSKATEDRNKHRAAEAAAEEWLVDVDAVHRDARDRSEDELEALEAATAAARPVVASARAAGLGDAAIGRIRAAAESNERGSGWAAVSKATEDRNKRRAAAEMAAGEWLVDIDAVRRDARDRSEDALEALEAATAAARPVVASARAAGLGDVTIGRIRAAAESTARGSGWAAVSKATEDRNKHRAAEAAAEEWLVDVDAVHRDARDRSEDALEALEAATAAARPVVASARAAGLGDAAIGRIRAAAESNERGSGWAAVSKATEDRNKRRAAAEMAAGEWLVDIDAVRRDARDRSEDALEALEAATAAARPVVASARAAGLGDVTIGRIRAAAESTARGSGWAAVSKATEDRNKHRAAEAAAEEWLVDVDAVHRDARDRSEDELEALEAATAAARPVVASARAAGLGDAAIGRIRAAAESNERGSGWAAVSKATEDRNKRRAAAEMAAGEWLVDIDAVRRDARDRSEDALEALEAATAAARPVVASARAAGLGDAAIGRIRAAAESNERGSGWAAVSEATEELTEQRRELAAEERRKRGELAELTAEVRATSAGAEWLEEKRRARLDATKRSLTLDEELIVVREVNALIEADLARRAGDVEASLGGAELLRRAERRRGGSPQRLTEREEAIVAVELRVQAADAAVASLAALARDPERPDRRVPPVINAMLDAVPADSDGPFLEDVVRLLQARFAQDEQKDADRGGYDAAEDREKSARRHFGSALASAFEWCVLKIRALILAACHKILGGRGETGARVQAAFEAADAKRQSRQLEAHEEARTVAIDPNAFSEEARANGRDEVAAIMEETARRRQVISDAAATDIDVQAVFRAAEARENGSGFSAIEAAVERHRKAVAAAQRLVVDVDAVCATARSKNEDPVEALQHETARRTRVRLFADFIGLSYREFDDIFRAAEQQRRGSGYTAIEDECIRRLASELVKEELPFAYSGPVHSGTWALAVFGRAETDLLRRVQDDGFVHGRLTEVMAASPGSAEERQGAERSYHHPEIERELQRLEAQRGRFSSKPTEEDALQVVLKRFIPELADRVRAACAGIADLDRSVAHIVDADWVRRVVEQLPGALPSARPVPGGSSSTAACMGLNGIAAATDDDRLKKVIVAYQTQHDYDAGYRQHAENVLLERGRREEEVSEQTRANAEATANRAHETELLRILQEVCRQVQSREFGEICRERDHMRKTAPVRPNHHEQGKGRPDHSQGWTR